jgi:hypothetical protein
MAIEFRQILVLILALVSFAFLCAGAGYIVGWIISRILRWLFKQKWFSRRVKQWKTAWDNWWMGNKHIFEKFWAYISEVWTDVLFYSYALVVLVDKIEAFNQFTKQYPQYSTWELLELDMHTDTTFYIVFLIIFTIWLLNKIWRHNRDVKEKRELNKSLESIS